MLEKIVEPLLLWYPQNARSLPWREMATPYRVWVSEIMLQQTRVEAVKPFFERFITALPEVADLAVCPEEQLLKLWEGLGYYNRVRNMQKAAQKIMLEYCGAMPASYEALLSLPGIGSYTAGAVASIAFGIAVPAVDGNVLRVISRVTASQEDIMKQSLRVRMESDLKAIMPGDAPGAFNQALMELGATVCVPNGMAKCEVCPLRSLCLAKSRGIVMELPKKAPKKPRRIEKRTVLIIKNGDKIAIQKRPKKGLLAGLYELPNVEGHLSDKAVLKLLKGKQLPPVRIQKLPPAKHIFSHIEWQMIGYIIRIEELESKDKEPFIFVEPVKTAEKYPIPAAFSAYMEYLQIKLGQEKYDEMERQEEV